jgi:hypothetical protein
LRNAGKAHGNAPQSTTFFQLVPRQDCSSWLFHFLYSLFITESAAGYRKKQAPSAGARLNFQS